MGRQYTRQIGICTLEELSALIKKLNVKKHGFSDLSWDVEELPTDTKQTYKGYDPDKQQLFKVTVSYTIKE